MINLKYIAASFFLGGASLVTGCASNSGMLTKQQMEQSLNSLKAEGNVDLSVYILRKASEPNATIGEMNEAIYVLENLYDKPALEKYLNDNNLDRVGLIKSFNELIKLRAELRNLGLDGHTPQM